VEAIRLADLIDGVGVGVPYIEARDQACDFSCDGLQCVLACPTGALTHSINYPAEARMGFARLARPEACLAAQGKGFKGQARGPDYRASCAMRTSTAGAPSRSPTIPTI
jgi:ferredoxin-type protein NapG